MPKLPFMQFYPGDWIQDTQTLSLEAQGAWINILCQMWLAPERGVLDWCLDEFTTLLRLKNDNDTRLMIANLERVGDISLLDFEGEWVSDISNAVRIKLVSRRIVRDAAKLKAKQDADLKYNEKGTRGKRSKNDPKTTRIYQKSEVRSHITEEDKTTPTPSSSLSVERLVELYNELTPDECPAVSTLSPARIAKAKKYLQAFKDEDFWKAAFQEIHRSTFLRGLKKSNGHEGFIASFDWLLTKGKDQTENVVKVQEGQYRDG